MKLALVALAVTGAAACADHSSPPPSPNSPSSPKPPMNHAAPQVVTDRSGPIELAASAAGAVVHVVLRNRGEAPVTVYFAADGPNGHPRHHDFLRVDLRGPGGERTLHLAGDRNTSTIGLVELAPGAETADDVDLAGWAADAVNGAAPLAAGAYQATLIYQVADQAGVWNGVLRAGPLTIQVP